MLSLDSHQNLEFALQVFVGDDQQLRVAIEVSLCLQVSHCHHFHLFCSLLVIWVIALIPNVHKRSLGDNLVFSLDLVQQICEQAIGLDLHFHFFDFVDSHQTGFAVRFPLQLVGLAPDRNGALVQEIVAQLNNLHNVP